MVTHEPEIPFPDWPYSHVYIEDVFFSDYDECIKVTIHGVEHYLHRTTALSLYEQLQTYFKNLSPQDKQLLTIYGSKLGDELY